MKRLPELTLDLLKELEQAYPSLPPDLSDNDRMVWFKAGQRDVVETLLARMAAGLKAKKRITTAPNEEPLDTPWSFSTGTQGEDDV